MRVFHGIIIQLRSRYPPPSSPGRQTMKYVSYFAIALASAAFTVWMIEGSYFIGPSRSLNPPTFDITYADFVSLLLTVLIVIIASLALTIGLVAFRTIGEIKREAGRIAQDHSKSEIERSLGEVPERVTEAVEKEVKELLPSAIDKAVVDAGKAGRLDEALQKALMQFSVGGGAAHSELQPEFEAAVEGRKDDAER